MVPADTAGRMNREALLQAGYREYKPGPYDMLYQKPISDANGVRYYLNIRFWQHSKNRPGIEDGWDAKVYIINEGSTFEVTLHNAKRMTLTQVEKIFDDIWNRVRPDTYAQRKGE